MPATMMTSTITTVRPARDDSRHDGGGALNEFITYSKRQHSVLCCCARGAWTVTRGDGGGGRKGRQVSRLSQTSTSPIALLIYKATGRSVHDCINGNRLWRRWRLWWRHGIAQSFTRPAINIKLITTFRSLQNKSFWFENAPTSNR